MTPSYRRELQQFHRSARKTSWTLYRKVLGRLCQEYGDRFPFVTPISGFLRNGDIRGLVDHADALTEQQYVSATEHFVAHQFSSLILKYPFPQKLNPFNPEETAIEKFKLSEASCLKINWTLDPRFPERRDTSFEPLLSKMRSFIRYVLGEQPHYGSIWERCRITPGASIGVHGNATNLARKIGSDWTVSPGAVSYALAAMRSNAQLFELLARKSESSRFYSLNAEEAEEAFLKRVKLTNHNKIAFVPKTVKTYRSIAVEPFLNSFVQKGIDEHMRLLLSRVGIDLSDQGVNQQLARIGSDWRSGSDDRYSTLDLSSASDSISIELVRDILPPDWFDFLNSVRSKNYLRDGTITRYEKFCSMGNGFCFPLETLIFASACHAVSGVNPSDRVYSVYGDDIIIKPGFAPLLADLLAYIGFALNEKKTFFEGPFRESCGADWYLGEDVRPFKFDFALETLEDYFKLLNLTQRSEKVKTFFSGIREYVISLIPPRLRFARPFSGQADTAYTVELDEFMANQHSRWNKSLQCWSWVELLHLPVKDKWVGLRDADLSHLLVALGGGSSQMPFTVRLKRRTTMRRVAHG